MKFKNIRIKNFRNYEDISVNLSNKNIFFGMNDIGKTNLLYAIRYVFDKNIRKQNLVDTDFHNKNINTPIEILVCLDIEEEN
ncbi:MAG: AAA family ATPase, partial [Anaeroplasmataceae bacterium]|nr:AAA family ATPase [Anaeroplasmataceae bacterium]